mmetsp:Transcript_57196/g.51496  ORF Transcript_57196/g.51496 Transcript_57196/m.51496 type:complete len:521 (+) Transcript_57196:40-1602(+)
MSNLFNPYGLITSAATVYGVYKLGKTAYEINSNSHPPTPTGKGQFRFPNKGDEHEHESEEESILDHQNQQERVGRSSKNVNYSYYKEETIGDKIIFVPKQYTERAIYEDYILERFESNKQLFYYLRRRSNMEAIHGNLRIFKFNDGKSEILVFNTDLHCNNVSGPYYKNRLYVVGTKNDKEINDYSHGYHHNHYRHNNGYHHHHHKNKTIEKWKMSEYFMTSREIRAKYGITKRDLPSGSKKILGSTNDINMDRLIHRKNNVSLRNYTELKPIKTKLTGHRVRGHTISKQLLHQKIKESNTFRPIISFSEDKNIYYIDMVLLINIGTNSTRNNYDNYIGIIFRDYKGDKTNYMPIDMAVDCYDIRNKMMLYQPPRDESEYDQIYKYQNNISLLHLIDEETLDDLNDDWKDDDTVITECTVHTTQCDQNYQKSMDLEARLKQATQRLLSLENKVKEQKVTIDQQSQSIQMLKEQNNHYFQQCLDPNSNIKPHIIHAQATKLPSITVFVDNNNFYHVQQQNE